MVPPSVVVVVVVVVISLPPPVVVVVAVVGAVNAALGAEPRFEARMPHRLAQVTYENVRLTPFLKAFA